MSKTKPETTHDESKARPAIVGFVNALADWLAGNSQGLAFIPNSPAQGWELMEFDHPVGALMWNTAADGPVSDQDTLTVAVGFVFHAGHPSVVAGERLQQFCAALTTKLVELVGSSEIKQRHVYSSAKRDAFVVSAKVPLALLLARSASATGDAAQ